MQETVPAKPAASRPRWFWPVIMSAVVVTAVAFYVLYIYPQPAITLSDFSYATTACSRLGNSSTMDYTYFFNLTNSGTATGTVTVAFTMDGWWVGVSQFKVAPGTSQRILWPLDWPDCEAHRPGASIYSVSRT